MAKEKEKDRIELRPVDEDAEEATRYVRLHPDAVEEVVELPLVRVGGKGRPEARLMATREKLKTRSNEPDVGSLIEREQIRAEEQWETANVAGRRIPVGWFALLVFVFAGGVIWSLVEVNRAKDKQDSLVVRTESSLEKEKREKVDAELMITTIEKTARSFFDSRSVEQMLRYVRHPARVGPLMEKYYGSSSPFPPRVYRVTSMDPLTIDKRAAFWRVSCELQGGGNSQILVEVISASEAKIDWETFVCYQPMDWNEFAKNRPSGYTGDFRVYVEPDNYYSHEFLDNDTYLSFRLTALGGEQTLYGYVARTTDLENRMQEAITENGGGVTPMVLRLQIPEGVLSKNGLVVKEMLSPRWMFLDNPEKEKP